MSLLTVRDVFRPQNVLCGQQTGPRVYEYASVGPE